MDHRDTQHFPARFKTSAGYSTEGWDGNDPFEKSEKDMDISRLAIQTYGYGSIRINTIFSGMNIHLPAILMLLKMAINSEFFPLKVVIFHSYVSLPEGIQKICLKNL